MAEEPKTNENPHSEPVISPAENGGGSEKKLPFLGFVGSFFARSAGVINVYPWFIKNSNMDSNFLVEVHSFFK